MIATLSYAALETSARNTTFTCIPTKQESIIINSTFIYISCFSLIIEENSREKDHLWKTI